MTEIFEIRDNIEIPEIDDNSGCDHLESVVNRFMHLHSGDEPGVTGRITPATDPVLRRSNYQVSTGEVVNFAYIVDSIYKNKHGTPLTDADYELCENGVVSEDVNEILEEGPHYPNFAGYHDDRDAEWISEGAPVGREVGSLVDEIYDMMDDPTKEELREMAVDATHYRKCS